MMHSESNYRLKANFLSHLAVNRKQQSQMKVLLKVQVGKYLLQNFNIIHCNSTENATLKSFPFCSIIQEKTFYRKKCFIAFCKRVEKEAQHYHFKCSYEKCSSEPTSVRDQIVTEVISDKIWQEVLQYLLHLITFRKNGIRLGGAAKGSSEIPEDKLVYKLEKRLYRNLINKSRADTPNQYLGTDCNFCGAHISSFIVKYVRQCEAKKAESSNCKKKWTLWKTLLK